MVFSSMVSFSVGCVCHRFMEATEPLAILFRAQGQGLAHSLSPPGAQHEHHQSLGLNEWKPVCKGDKVPPVSLVFLEPQHSTTVLQNRRVPALSMPSVL